MGQESTAATMEKGEEHCTGPPPGVTLPGTENPSTFIPAVLFGEPVEGDASVSAGTLEKPLQAVMPVVVMLLADADLQRLEVGVGTLHRASRPHTGQGL